MKIFKGILIAIYFILLTTLLVLIGNNKVLTKIWGKIESNKLLADNTIIEYDLSATNSDHVIGKLNIETGKLVVSGTGRMKDLTYNDIDIGSYNGHNDHAIFGDKALAIKEIEIQNGVTHIGSYIFGGCGAINDIGSYGLVVNIANSVTSIGEGAFYWSRVAVVNLPNSIDRIEEDTFWACNQLTDIEIPSNVKSIGENAFEYSGLSLITFHEGLETIGECAFKQTKLKNVTFPSTVKTIDGHAFYLCEYLSDVTFNEGLKTIGENAFDNCIFYSCTITIPSTVESIGTEAFADSKINRLVLKNGIKEIGDRAFSICNFSNVEIPKSVTTIGINPFVWCRNLESITVDSSNSNFKAVDGVLFNKNITKLISYPANKDVTEYVVPSTVNTIGSAATHGTVKLVTITIPSSVTNIEEYQFVNSEKLTTISVDANNPNYRDLDGVLYNKNITKIINYPTKKPGEIYTLPNTVNTIGGYAFSYSDLKEVEVPEGLINVNESAFKECKLLETVDLNEGLKFIGEDAFERSSIMNINIPSSIETVERYAFSECKNIKSITLPKKQIASRNIGYGTFENSQLTLGVKENADNKYETIYPEALDIDKEYNGATISKSGCQVVDGKVIIEKDRLASAYMKVSGGALKELIIKFKEIEVESIDIIPPTKLDYFVGDSLDLTGLKIHVKYDNGEEEELEEGFSVSMENNTILTEEGTQEITVSFRGQEANFEINVQKVELVGIEVTPPTKLTYYVGDKLDLTGLKVKAIYNNGQEIDMEEGFTVSMENNAVLTNAGEQQITVSFGGKEASFEISVQKVELDSITVTTSATKRDYIEGQNFNISGMKIKATYNNGVTKILEDNEYIVTNGNGLEVGQTSVTISYTDTGITKTATQNITVIAKEVTNIQMNVLPAKVNYYVGERLDLTGLKILVKYNDDEEKEITSGYTSSIVNGSILDSAGTKTITITYRGKTASFQINVIDVILERIAITKDPNKLEYYEGESFDPTGMEITAYYNNRDSRIITTGYEISPSGALSLNDTKITVTYQGKEASLNIGNKIIINKVEISKIAIKKAPNKVDYIEGEMFDPDGMQVIAYYNNGDIKTINDYALSANASRPLTLSVKEITVTYQGKEAIQQINVVEEELVVTIDKYEIVQDGDITYLEGIQPKTPVQEILNEIRTNGEIKVYYQNGNRVSNYGTYAATEMKIIITKGSYRQEYVLVVRGDVNSDGEANFADILLINRHRLNKVLLKGGFLRAGNVNSDFVVDFNDMLKINKFRLGKISVL